MVNVGGYVDAGDAHWASKRNNTASSWWRDAGLRKLNFWIGICFLSQVSIGYDGSLLNGLQAMPQWLTYFGNGSALGPNASLLGIMSAAQSLGGIPAGPVSSYIADRWGRRVPMIVGALITVVGAIVQATCHDVNTFIGSRVLIGFGNVMNSAASPVLATEIAHPRMRGPSVSLFNTTYYVGSIIAAWTTYGSLNISSEWSWRFPALLQCGSSVIQIIAVLLGPESPRYLVSKGRVEEAHKMLAKYHGNGDLNDELVIFELEEIKNTLELEKEAAATGWSELWSTRGNRHRSLLCICIGFAAQFNGVGIISYYLAPILRTVGITDPNQQAGLNGGLQVWNYACAILGSMLVDKVGRRGLWLSSTVLMLISYILITALSASYDNSGNAKIGQAVIAWLFIYYGSYDIAYTGLTISYPCEIMPFTIRTKGLAIVQTSTWIALCVNQYVNPIALAAIGWKYYLVYIAILAVLLVIVYFYYPETRGKTLEEVAIVFDGPESRTLPDVERLEHDMAVKEKTSNKNSIEHIDNKAEL